MPKSSAALHFLSPLNCDVRRRAAPLTESSPDAIGEKLSFFFRHLVGLGVTISNRTDDGESAPRTLFFSCTIIHLADRYNLLTAGHILEPLSKGMADGRVLLHSAQLVDWFGADARFELPIPFDLESANVAYIHRDGLDFGLISLSSYYVRLLARNGVVGIHDENWESQHTVDFNSYFMIGLPTEWTETVVEEDAGQIDSRATVSATLIPIERLPDDDKTAAFPRFAGSIGMVKDLESIEGMSGGPIIGFRHSEAGGSYWVVAIQSSWFPKQRLIFGCPIPVLAGLVRQISEDANSAGADRAAQ